MGYLKKNENNSFSFFPKIGYNKKDLTNVINGIYVSFNNKEIFAFYDEECSRLTLNPLAKKEKSSNRDIIEQLEYYGKLKGGEKSTDFIIKQNGFFTASLCCFHPDYVKIDNDRNDLEITLEMEHKYVPKGFIINTKNTVTPPAPKIGILKYF
jgi:hypothetical protein